MNLKNFICGLLVISAAVACDNTNPDLQDSFIDDMNNPSGSTGAGDTEDDAGTGDNGDSNDNGSSGSDLNELELKLLGKWMDQSNSKRTVHFLENGEGYAETLKAHGGIQWTPFDWRVEDGSLFRKNHSGTSEYDEEIQFAEDGTLSLTDDYGSDTYKQLSKNGTTNVNYKKPPYTNYICIWGCYYELLEVVMKCDHSTGTEGNMKSLLMFGANGTLEPIGARFMYFTPYYDGIDKMWYDGKYYIESDSDYYTYGGVYCYNSSWSSRCDGELTIKSSGNIMTFDFDLDDGEVTGHYAGILQ